MTTTPPDGDLARPTFNSHNTLVLIGVLVTSVGLIYFATTFLTNLSQWGKLAILLLFCIGFIAFGLYFENTDASQGVLFEVKGLRWVRVPSALYVQGAIAGLVAVIYFVSQMDVDQRVKVLATTVVGVALIVGAGRFAKMGKKTA